MFSTSLWRTASSADIGRLKEDEPADKEPMEPLKRLEPLESLGPLESLDPLELLVQRQMLPTMQHITNSTVMKHQSLLLEAPSAPLTLLQSGPALWTSALDQRSGPVLWTSALDQRCDLTQQLHDSSSVSLST